MKLNRFIIKHNKTATQTKQSAPNQTIKQLNNNRKFKSTQKLQQHLPKTTHNLKQNKPPTKQQ